MRHWPAAVHQGPTGAGLTMHHSRAAIVPLATVGLLLLSLLAERPQVSGDLTDPPAELADEAEVKALMKLKDLSETAGGLDEWTEGKDPCGASDCVLTVYGAGNDPSSYPLGGAEETGGSNETNVTLPDCQFPGVSCEDWRVTSLSLPGLSLGMAHLPVELADLSRLRSLDLSQNAIRGVLPQLLLQGLTGLESLVLARNSLSGSLPVQLSVLSTLQVLDLSNNQLDGFIPYTISAMTSLQVLDLSHNSLVGQMPYSLEQLNGTLQELDITGNCGICGSANATSSPDSIYTSLESLKIEGTHVWQSCANYNSFGCEDSLSYFSLGVQILVVAIFLVLASMLTCIVCTYIRHRHIFAILNFGQDRGAAAPPPLSPGLGGSDEASGLHGHLGTPVGGEDGQELKVRRSMQPIEAVIINPGSTVMSPNICVAVVDSQELNHQQAMQRRTGSPQQLRSEDGPGASTSDSPYPAEPSLGSQRSVHVVAPAAQETEESGPPDGAEFSAEIRWTLSSSSRLTRAGTHLPVAPEAAQGPLGSLRASPVFRWLRGQRGQ